MCTLIGYLGFMGNLKFNCFVGCFSMIVWAPAVLSVLYACVLYFCICTCSAQLSMFHLERRSRNTITIIMIIIQCVCPVWTDQADNLSGLSLVGNLGTVGRISFPFG